MGVLLSDLSRAIGMAETDARLMLDIFSRDEDPERLSTYSIMNLEVCWFLSRIVGLPEAKIIWICNKLQSLLREIAEVFDKSREITAGGHVVAVIDGRFANVSGDPQLYDFVDLTVQETLVTSTVTMSSLFLEFCHLRVLNLLRQPPS